MPRYSVHIAETTTSLDAPVAPNEPTPVVRDVVWEGDADDEKAAKKAGYRAWEQKHGDELGGALIRVTPLDDA